MESKQECDGLSVKSERLSCMTCKNRTRKRPWLLASSILLNILFAITAVTTAVLFIATGRAIVSYSTDSTHLTGRNGLSRTCLLGVTQFDIDHIIENYGFRSYPGQTCAEVGQEGDVPYYTTTFYEIAIDPNFIRRSKRELISTVNNEFGSEHMHWRSRIDEQRKEIEDRMASTSASHQRAK